MFIEEIPLAGIFTTGMVYIGDVNNLAAEVRNMTCGNHGDSPSHMSSNDWTA